MSSSSAPESELFGPRIRAPAEAHCPWDVVIRVSTFGNAYLLNAFRAVSKSAQNEISRIVDERLLPEHRRLAQSLVRRTLRRSALRRASTAPDLEDGAAGAAGAADDALSSALNSADFVESLRRAATMPMLRSVELLGARPAISRVSLALLSLRSDDAAGSPSEAVGLAADGAFCDLVDDCELPPNQTHLVSIGDSVFERNAAHYAAQQFGTASLKTVKFIDPWEGPTVPQLTAQLEGLGGKLRALCMQDKSVDMEMAFATQHALTPTLATCDPEEVARGQGYVM